MGQILSRRYRRCCQRRHVWGNKTKKSYAKRMIGSYMFRVDFFLRPEDLEPTEELRAALDGIKQTKNVINMIDFEGYAKGN